MKNLLRIPLLCLVLTICQAQEFVPFLGTPASDPNNLLTGLQAFWEFDELTGTVADSSGNSRTLSENGTVDYTPNGIRAGARSLAGPLGLGVTTNYLYRTSESAFSFNTNAFTISAWIQINNTAQDSTIISKFDFADGKAWLLEYDFATTNRFLFRYSSDGSADIDLEFVPTDTFVDNDWWFVVVRYDGVDVHLTAALFTSGSIPADATQAFAGPFFDNPLVPITFGNINGGGQNNALYGALDDIGLWNVYKSDCEITKLFNNGAAKAPSTFNAIPCAP